ncbi:MAG: 23S rRNA (pseudouridine(1915)-N(3))-methyltransferase RlmH [Gemmatimonadota bacterium]
MNIHIHAVGRLRTSYRAICDEYLKRLGRYAEVAVREVKEAGTAPTPAVQRKQEGERLLAAIPADATVVALAVDGRAISSEELAVRLDGWRAAARPLAVVIGGPEGLASDVLDRATFRWSLGPLTLPHELARVVVLEQLYRAFSILGGSPYHRGAR